MEIDYLALDIFTLVVQGITSLLGILGNGLVIWVAGFRMARTVTTVCYLNLALADFFFTATLPLFMVVYVMKAQWPFGPFLCKFINTVGDTNLFGSVFLIAFIALDRCICVRCPVWAQNHRTVSLAKKLIIVPWILALLLTLPVLIFTTTQTHDDNKVYCVLDVEFGGNITEEEKIHKILTMSKIIAINRFVVGFTFPMSIIAICYGLIIAKICKNVRNNSKRPLRVLTGVMVSFFICWFPFQLCLLLWALWAREILFEGKYEILTHLRHITGQLAFFNSCLNPMLYVFVGQDFREKLIQSLPASLERALTEDSAPTSDANTSPASDSTEVKEQEL